MTANDAPARTEAEAVFAEGLSGYGPGGLITGEDLLALSELCLAADRIVHTIEAYAVTDEYQQLTPEFSLFGQDPREKARAWPDRARDSHALVTALVAEANTSERPIQYQVWLDWGDEAESA